MFIRTIKSLGVVVLAYGASRSAVKHAKLISIRNDADAEMKHLETKMKEMYDEDRSTASSYAFQDLTRQYNKWARVYGKTF